MLGFIFGFNARLGRLAYFLSCIGFGVGVVILGLLLFLASRGAHGPNMAIAAVVITGIILVVWFAMCLLSMRIRDMGWNPAIVIPLFWALIAVDAYVSVILPDWAMPGRHYGTIVGASINFLFNLAVMFWPSAGYDTPTLSVPEALGPRSEASVPPAVIRAAPSEPTVPVMRQAASSRKAFGRLGQQH
jgi:uncharacterized membrane protein YhaH (DUF805 family)